MKRAFLTSVLVLCGVGAAFAIDEPAPPAAPAAESAAPAPAEAADPADLAWAREMNGSGYAAPPTEFRPGHVSPRALPADALTRREDGFAVRFPSGAPITTPAVHRGRVVVSGGFKGKELYALDARTGRLAWGLDLDDDGPSAPACEGGVCVFNTESCTIFAVSADTGALLWSWWMGDPMLAAPAIAGGTVFTSYPAAPGARHPDASHVLAALDLKTGAVRWQRWIDGDVISAPVAADGEIHLATFSGTVFAFSQEDGRILAAERNRATSAPTVVGEDLYWTERSEAEGQAAREVVVRTDRRSRASEGRYAEKDAPYLDSSVQAGTGYSSSGAALDADNGFAGGAPSSAKAGAALANVGQGSVSRLQAYQGSRVVNGGDNNYSAMGDEVICTDARTGAERWRHKLDGDVRAAGGFLAAPPVVAGGKVVIGTLAGELLVMDPGSGTVLRRFAVGHPIRSQPVVHEGWIYVGTEDGLLIGIDTAEPALSGWPMWGGDAARTASAG